MSSVMIGVLSLYEVFAYFFIYSFLGWITEVGFHAITQGKFVNRGFLNGPVCPIYGVGVVLVLLILGKYANVFWLVFLVGVALPTAIEFLTGFAMEKIFHNKWWDYSDRKFNVKGYICLEFSLLWGVAVVFVICVIHPAVKWFAGLFSEIVGTVLVCVFAAAMLADLVVTVLQVCKLNQKLKELDDIAKAMRKSSELIGEIVADATLAVDGKVSVAREKLAPTKEKLRMAIGNVPKRLLKAFPRLKSRVSPEGAELAKRQIAKPHEEPEQDMSQEGMSEE